MKKKLFTVFMLVAVVCIAAVGIAACEDGDWLEGTYVYSSCTVEGFGNVGGFGNMDETMKNTYDEMFAGSSFTFNKDKVTMNQVGMKSTLQYKLDGDKIIITEGEITVGNMAVASVDMRLDGDTIYYSMNVSMSGMNITLVMEYVRQA